MESCIYAGTVTHRRHRPRTHAFSHEVFMAYLDLAELPGLFDLHPLWSARRPALGWFRRADYLGGRTVPLDRAVRELVAARSGQTPRGPIRLLTNLRLFGYCIKHLVAEVTNTPWGERHAYVAPGLESEHDKALHVSPFMAMEQRYRWRAGLPGERLSVQPGQLLLLLRRAAPWGRSRCTSGTARCSTRRSRSSGGRSREPSSPGDCGASRR